MKKFKSIMIFVNDLDFLLSHRKELVQRYHSEFHKCFVVYGKAAPASLKVAKEIGLTTYNSFLLQNKFSLYDFLRLISLLIFFIKIRPCLAHSITIKAILVHSILGCLVPIQSNLFAFAGLGKLFEKSLRKKIFHKSIIFFLKVFINRVGGTVIIQNKSDLRILKKTFGSEKLSYVRTLGSGINIDEFKRYDRKQQSRIPTLLFASRLLKAKGIEAYIDAVTTLKLAGYRFNAKIAGKLVKMDNDYISESKLIEFSAYEDCEYLGEVKNMHMLWPKIDIFVLPSSYNEGVPKVILEAHAARCAIVCSKRKCMTEIIKDKHNGRVIPKPYDTNLLEILADLIPNLVARQNFADACGAIDKLDVEQVVSTHLQTIAD
jgi:glycosyltransferase involved in cell wall biosynthesis